MNEKAVNFCGLMSFILLLVSVIFFLKPNNYIEYKYPNSEAIIIKDISLFERNIYNAKYLEGDLFDIENANFQLVFKNVKNDTEDYRVYFKEDSIGYLIYNTHNNKFGRIEDTEALRSHLHYEMDNYLNSIG